MKNNNYVKRLIVDKTLIVEVRARCVDRLCTDYIDQRKVLKVNFKSERRTDNQEIRATKD